MIKNSIQWARPWYPKIMRIERTGLIEPLTPRVARFLVKGLRAIAIDEIESHEARRIDYEWRNGLLAIELKSLEGSPTERTNNFVDQLRDRPDFPYFFGSVPMEAAFKHMEGADQLRRAALMRLGRPIVTHLKKANDQLAAHDTNYPRRDRVRIMLLLNEDHPEYDPHTVAWIVQKEFGRQADGLPRYPSIDAVVFITERHVAIGDDSAILPTVAIHGPNMGDTPWKDEVLATFMARWSKWNGREVVSNEDPDERFVAVEHIPESMPKHEAWRIAYRRNPFFRPLSDEQLRDEFDEVIVVTSLCGMKGAPMVGNQEAFSTAVERFTHIQEEMHHRALPMDAFSYSSERQITAGRRMKLAPDLMRWLIEFENRR